MLYDKGINNDQFLSYLPPKHSISLYCGCYAKNTTTYRANVVTTTFDDHSNKIIQYIYSTRKVLSRPSAIATYNKREGL